jgi:hypothetical protein
LQVSIREIHPAWVSFELAFGGEYSVFQQNVALEKRFSPQPNGSDQTLVYQWTPE